MSQSFKTATWEGSQVSAAALTIGGVVPVATREISEGERVGCFHCGERCRDRQYAKGERVFCCQGCLVVHELLTESGLEQFYDLSRHPGVRIRRPSPREQWAFLDEPQTRERLLDFTDGKISRVTFHVPAMHCVACVWLLENLFRLHGGIGSSRVNFPRREVSIQFSAPTKLSEVAGLLASIGYEPRLTLGELEQRTPDKTRRRRWLQVGVAGFAFGNIMLFSFPGYLGLDTLNGAAFRAVFGWLSLALALPVVVYSASDYWRSAWLSFRQRVLTLDVPIAAGLGALYGWSAFEILSGHGEGYLDSLSGLVFLLLCGRVFQQKTHERMAFDRDYKCFFPLSATRRIDRREESVAISRLAVGDRLVLRNGELIPADARLREGPACIDYSFVTGESDPVVKEAGEYLYAGGKQVGGVIEVEIVKPVSQSYLTSLWSHEAFQKKREDTLDSLTNRYSRRFTKLVIAIAVSAAVFWVLFGDAGRGVKAFASVLIVACPCALALAAPFTLGTAQRLLARRRVFLKNASVIERLAQVDAVVFDKTGTLTGAAGWPRFYGCPASGSAGWKPAVLAEGEGRLVAALCRQSTHPISMRIAESLEPENCPVTAFQEVPGNGIEGIVGGRLIRLGSRSWLEASGIAVPDSPLPAGSAAYLAIDGSVRGAFVLESALRTGADQLPVRLGARYELALLSGDNEKQRPLFRELFGADAALHFNQSPMDKLKLITRMQQQGRVVMMVGDGLNDAGALKQSDVGVAVVEKAGAFSPASDIILAADQVPDMASLLELARRATRIVRWSFGISALYNAVGISIAAAGILSPLICAVLMPVSSVTVVLFACGATRWAERNLQRIQP